MRNGQNVLAVLILRDRNRCHICGRGEAQEDPWTIEHVLPKARGGTDELANLRVAHRSCNLTKGTHLVASYDETWRKR